MRRTPKVGQHMALRIARGLFRLWLVLSVLWIGAVGTMTWSQFDVRFLSDEELRWFPAPIRPGEVPPEFDPSQPSTVETPAEAAREAALRARVGLPPDAAISYEDAVRADALLRRDQTFALVRSGAQVGLLPPVLILVVGSSLIWAFRGFRS